MTLFWLTMVIVANCMDRLIPLTMSIWAKWKNRVRHPPLCEISHAARTDPLPPIVHRAARKVKRRIDINRYYYLTYINIIII